MPQNRPEQIKQFILSAVPDHPRDIVPLTARQFQVTPTTVHRHLNKLLQQGEVIKTGRTRGAVYFLKLALQRNLTFSIKPSLDENQVWMEHFHEPFSALAENVYSICKYGFRNIFNNAVHHSQGTTITVSTKIRDTFVDIRILDDGVGTFKKIKNTLKLENERASILEITKGKLTTDPDNHTGAGIYFTSRAVDKYAMASSDLGYMRNNLEDDWFIETSKDQVKGTGVALQINLNSSTLLQDVFGQYSTFGSDTGLSNITENLKIVELSKLNQDHYISRSQGKKILIGLEVFHHIIFDFRDIKAVGQGFVDEVFRIFQKKNPHIKIEWTNANEDVRFMIERGLPNNK
jgi:hypothetical protein